MYELAQIFSSYLRCYALMGKHQDIYREIQVTICMPLIDKYLKQTLNIRQTQQASAATSQLPIIPIAHFFTSIKVNIIDGCLKHLLAITSSRDPNEGSASSILEDHHTPGFDFFGKCVW